MTTLTLSAAETDALTARTKATWVVGDFGKIVKAYEPGAADFIARLDLQPGDHVLDVACGTGAGVTSSDLEQLWTQHNRVQDGTTQVDSTELEVIAFRK